MTRSELSPPRPLHPDAPLRLLSKYNASEGHSGAPGPPGARCASGAPRGRPGRAGRSRVQPSASYPACATDAAAGPPLMHCEEGLVRARKGALVPRPARSARPPASGAGARRRHVDHARLCFSRRARSGLRLGLRYPLTARRRHVDHVPVLLGRRRGGRRRAGGRAGGRGARRRRRLWRLPGPLPLRAPPQHAELPAPDVGGARRPAVPRPRCLSHASRACGA